MEGELIGTTGQNHVLLAEQSSPWAVFEVSIGHGLVIRQVAVPPGCQPLSIVSHNNTWWLLGAALEPRGAQWADVRITPLQTVAGTGACGQRRDLTAPWLRRRSSLRRTT